MRYSLLFLVVILFILLGNAASAQKVKVDGYAFLVGETNHEGIKIVFERTIPDKLKDSTQTDSSGYYSIQLEKGIYNIIMAKQGFSTINITDEIIYSDKNIKDTTLYKTTLKVDGNIFLEGETDYRGIKIVFKRTVPGILKDTTQTDSTGYYSIELDKGIYNIEFSNEEFYPCYYNDIIIYSDITLKDTTLEKKFKSKGILKKDEYNIKHDIEIKHGDTLIIEAGCKLIFYPGVRFDIHGLLIAEGSLGDTILFTYQWWEFYWKGLKFFDDADDNSSMKYCIVEGSDSSGIYINKCSPTLSHLWVRNNTIGTNVSNFMGGLGLCLVNSYSVINDIKISDNFASVQGLQGGGILVNGGNPIINNAIINNNTIDYGAGISIKDVNSSTSNNPILINSIVSNNMGKYGGGISFMNSTKVEILNVQITNNTSTINGGGIYCIKNSNPVLRNIILNNNKSNSGGHEIYFESDSKTIIKNSTIFNNFNSLSNAVIYSKGKISISNSIFYCNTSDLIESEDSLILFNCLIKSKINNFPVYNSNKWLGINLDINVNGDSCDAYFNIQKDPMFVDAEYGDFHLKPGSPCIDAGDNKYVIDSTDFDGFPRILTGRMNGKAIVDMGAYEFNPATPVQEPVLKGNEISIHPNPFNSLTNITLPDNIYNASLILFDILGNKVKEINNIKTNNIILKKDNLQTGIYFYLLMDSGKMSGNGKIMIY